jgi:hypothetical protein
MSGNFWCSSCKTWINKVKPFIACRCSSDDCCFCEYYCDDLCVETTGYNNLVKCNECDCKVTKEIIKIN